MTKSTSPRQQPKQDRRASHIKAHYADRHHTPLETAVDGAWDQAENLRRLLPDEADRKSLTFHPQIAGAVFCGHVMADLDSIGGAIAASHLHDGVAARASDVNSETKFALDHWGLDLPEPIEDVMRREPKRDVCLVDFQQQSQLNPAIPMPNIVGVIDHHALQNNTIVTEKPVFVDIRPWGCMCSILAHTYAVQGRYLPKKIAGVMLSAILSDTLNLRSPTSTEWDERMVAMLVQYVELDDVNKFAAAQFRAKSRELAEMTPYALVNGDMKKFKFAGADGKALTIGYGVIETTDKQASLDRVDEIIPEMGVVRDEEKLTAILLAVVDIVNLESALIICGPVEASLALASYGGELVHDGRILRLGGRVSRKKDFIPPLTRAVEDGWVPPPTPPPSPEERKMSKRKSRIVMDYSFNRGSGRLVRLFDDMDA